MNKLFGTDGIRGEAGKFPLDETTIERFGYSLATQLQKRLGSVPTIILGRDTRESGEWIEAAIMRGLHAAQAQHLSAGIITTPGVAYVTRLLKADAGIVISASHNPFMDNGLKVFSPTGQKLDEAMERTIEADLHAEDFNWPPIHSLVIKRDLEHERELQQNYLQFLQTEMGANLNLAGLKIVVDCANGAAYELAPALFRSLGAEIIAINVDPTGRNINLNSGALHTEQLQAKVVELRADLGIAFDGDADRALFVDTNGNLVDGDQVLYIVTKYLSEQNQLSGNRCVATVMSNLGLELGLRQLGIELIRTSVGDKYVLDELLKNGGSIGGEQSGHVIFPQISLAGDGMITALEILRVMRDADRSLADLAGGFTRYPQVIINVKVGSKPPLDSVPPIKAMIDRLNGELAGSGRLLLRYSGTENLARVMIEGQNEATIRQQAEAMAQTIRECLV